MKTSSAIRFSILSLCFAVVLSNPQNSTVKAQEPQERNIVFFITDDESPTLGCYGDPVAVTPNIDALASDGVLFRNAFATTASCSASRSVIMSGLHNHKNGQYGHAHHFHKFNSYPNVVSLSLPRVLANEGYRTALIGKYHVAPEIVFKFEKNLGRANPRNSVMMAESCREFINNRDDKRPFFLYFGTSDPHRGGGVDKTSNLGLKPNLFGNRKNRKAHEGVKEVFYDTAEVPIPTFLSDTPETREELSNYYQSCSRIDQGLGKLVEILKEAGVYNKTLIVFTSDHGMAFAGGKTTVYEPGLRVPFVVRNPYVDKRGVESDAMISHVDITPSLVDFAGGLDPATNGPRKWVDPDKFWKEQGMYLGDNRSGDNEFKSWHGKSWLPVVAGETNQHHDSIFASHTFHEITMYYPMRVVRDRKYKLIWNIASGLDYPFASDLWVASSWQAQFRKGSAAMYGMKTVDQYIHRPKFELYNIETDPHESINLAENPEYASVLKEYQLKLKAKQKEVEDPWIMKWDYE
jgi:N-sulfoglucosamine sulfohydrolase